MAVVPNYTKGLVLRREVANQVDPTAIQSAGAVARGVADIANIGNQVATVLKEKQDTSAVNSAVIERQKNDLDFREQLKKENADNPFGYAERVAPLYKERDKAIIESLPSEEARQAYKATAERLNLQNYEDDLRWQNTRSVEIFANRAEQSISDLEVMAYRGEDLEQIKRNRQATRVTLEGVLSPEQLAKFDQKSNEGIHKSFIEGQIDTNPYLARQTLDSRKYDNELGVDNITSLYAKTEKAIAADIKAQAAATKQQQQLSLIQGVKDGDFLLDPNDTDHKEAVEVDYQNFTSQLTNYNPNEALQAKVDYVKQVGVVPKQLKSEVSAVLNSGDPDMQLQMADLVEKIAIDNPRNALQFSERDRVYAKNLSESLNAGISGKRAVEFANKNLYEKDTPQYKERAALYKTEQKQFTESDFTELFRDDPNNVPAGMIADFNTLNRKYYMDGGADAKSSYELAKEKVKANWGITDTGGEKRWMKYAPELVYDNGAPKEWIREQLVADVTSSGVIVDDIEQFANGLILEVAPETITQPDPSYIVYSQNKDGIIEPLVTNGKVQVWKPDFQTSPMFKKLLEESQGDVNKAMARAKRARTAIDVKNTLEQEGLVVPEELGLGRAF